MSYRLFLFLLPIFMLFSQINSMEHFNALQEACNNLDVQKVRTLMQGQQLSQENIQTLGRILGSKAIPNVHDRYVTSFWALELGKGSCIAGSIFVLLALIFKGAMRYKQHLDLEAANEISNSTKELNFIANAALYTTIGVLSMACFGTLISKYLKHRYKTNISSRRIIYELLQNKNI